LAASLLFDYAWPLVRFPSARQRLAELAVHPVAPDIVALGSSRFAGEIVSGEISNLLSCECRTGRPVGVFNASIPAGDAISDEFVLRHIVARRGRPRLVLLEVSPETLNRCNIWLGLHVRRQLRWDEAPRYFLDACRANQGMRWAGERVNPVYYHREQVWQVLARFAKRLAGLPEEKVQPQTTAFSPAGAANSGLSLSWDHLLRVPATPMTPALAEAIRLSARDILGRMMRNYRLRGSTSAALERTLRFCQNQGIEVVLIGAPLTRAHRETYPPQVRREYHAFLNRVTQQYGCRFVDYSDRLPDHLFVDTHHVSVVGGVYFSRLLTYELLAPFCQSHGIGPGAPLARAG
jgi:hypothetical protein